MKTRRIMGMFLIGTAFATTTAAVGCTHDDDEAEQDVEPTNSVQIAPFADFMKQRDLKVSEADLTRVMTGETPICVADLLAQQDAIVRLPSGVLFMTAENQAKYDQAAQGAATYEDFVARLDTLGIAPTKDYAPSAITVAMDAGTGSDGGSGSDIDAGTGDGSGSNCFAAGCQPPPPPPPAQCDIVCTLTTSATTTAQSGCGAQSQSTSTDTWGLWPNSAIAHDKRVASADRKGTSPSYCSAPVCWTAYDYDYFSTNSDRNRRSFGADTKSQEVTLGMSCQPTAATAAACTDWTATIGGISAVAKVNGQLSATNNGPSVTSFCGPFCNWDDYSGLNIYTAATPNAYMSLTRPPTACAAMGAMGWPSSKGSSTTPKIDFNRTNTTTDNTESTQDLDIKGELNVTQMGVQGEPTINGTGVATGTTKWRRLYKNGSTISSGASTVTFEHHANVPGQYSFPKACPSITVNFKAGIDSMTSNTSKEHALIPVTDGGNAEVGSFHSNATIRATASFPMANGKPAPVLGCSSTTPGLTCNVSLSP